MQIRLYQQMTLLAKDIWSFVSSSAPKVVLKEELVISASTITY